MIAVLITCLALLALAAHLARSRRSCLLVHPDATALLAQLGLTSPEAFLRLRATTVSGHPDRCVGRLVLTDAAGCEHALYLKREHRVPWKERLVNAWAGFGWASKSVREARLLARLEGSDFGPRWLAAGEDGCGRAFLLLEESDLRDLRTVLAEATPAERRSTAHWLGCELARLHDLGFDHPDLYAPHVLLDPATERLCLLDWQRSRRRRIVPGECRWRDLAALAATLPLSLASSRDRLTLLRAYLRASEQPLPDLRTALARVRTHEQRLLRRRHIRLKREAPLSEVHRLLHTIEPHVLEVTLEFHTLCPAPPAWLHFDGVQGVSREWVDFAPGRRAHLIRQRSRIPWRERFGSRRRWTAPELDRAPLLVRLERQGLLAPRLLAMGQRDAEGFRTSLLLSETPPHDGSLRDRLAREPCASRRRALLDAVGDWLRRLHAAECFFAGAATECPLAVREEDATPRVVLLDADVLRRRRRARLADQVRDLCLLRRELLAAGCSRSEQLQALRAYLGEEARKPASLRRVALAVLAAEQ